MRRNPAGAYRMCTNPNCLGTYWCSQWGCYEPPEVEMDDSDFEEPLAKKMTAPHFASPVSPIKLDTIFQGYVPLNTKKATSWAVRAFEQLRDQRNEKSSEECPSDLLEKPTADSLNCWLLRFVVEARRENGKPYPPSSISDLLAGLYRYNKECNHDCPNFMNREDPTFKELTGSLKVTSDNVKHAAVFSPAEENALWDLKVSSDHAPVTLQREVLFYVGKAFCLRWPGTERLENIPVCSLNRP